MITVSLLIPCYHEVAFIESVIENALEQDFPANELEVLLIDGGSTDGTREIIEQYAKKHSSIHLLDNPDRFVPQAMNRGIRAARGSIIIRWDAHAAYPKHYVSRLVAWLKKTGAANVGGTWKIVPRNKSSKAEAIALVLAHPLGVGNAQYRLGTKEAREVDTVPFGCYSKSVFEQYGYYDERLLRNQDIELNRRIRRQGGRILLVPDVEITYFARSTFRRLWKNNFANGEWVIRTAHYTGTTDALSRRHFIPMAFILYLCFWITTGLGTVFGGIDAFLFKLISLPVLIYLLAIVVAAFDICRRQSKPGLFIYLVGSFIVLHLSYGTGSFGGIGKILTSENQYNHL